MAQIAEVYFHVGIVVSHEVHELEEKNEIDLEEKIEIGWVMKARRKRGRVLVQERVLKQCAVDWEGVDECMKWFCTMILGQEEMGAVGMAIVGCLEHFLYSKGADDHEDLKSLVVVPNLH